MVVSPIHPNTVQERNMLKRLIAGITVATIVGVGGVAVAAKAATPNETSTAAGSQHGRGARLLKAAAATAAETIGIDVKTLRAETKAKATIAAVATSRNVSPQSVIDAIVTKGTAKIDAALASGNIDAAKAAKLTTKLGTAAEKFVNDTTNFLQNARKHGKGRGEGNARRHRVGQALRVAATTIGVDVTELKSELKTGKSIADVASDHDVTAQTVVDALVAAATTRIDAAVEAGKIDAARAASMKERLANTFTALVNRTGSAHQGAASTAS